MTNIPVDWDCFAFKFSQNPRAAFENLATTLFCYEMHLPGGVFRYFNQPYIETQPVQAPDGLQTGFQAKYYDAATPLSSKENDLKKVITDAKKKYPDLQRILFYLNKEMSASTLDGTQKPAYQQAIEQCGEAEGVLVEWRVPSHMEQILLHLPLVRDLYFNPNPGMAQWMDWIQSRSQSIFHNIQSSIPYQGSQIKVQHDIQALSTLWQSEHAACVVYGDAGTGKSGIVKDLVQHQEAQGDQSVCLFFSSTDLDVEEENLFLNKYGPYQLEDLFSAYCQENRKVCIIESAEKFSALSYPKVFDSIIQQFINHGWKMIFTIRTIYKDSFCRNVLKDVTYDLFQVKPITHTELQNLSAQYQFPLPQNQKLCSLLQDLFYLQLYLKLDLFSLDQISSEEMFLRQVWDGVICNIRHRAGGLPVRREEMAEHIVLSMLQREASIYRSSAKDDQDALAALEESGIIAVYDNSPNLWMMGHDVYEELIVKHILDQRYQEETDVKQVLNGFGLSLRARKLYRIWLESIIANGADHCPSFLISVFQSDLDQTWKDETMIALMQTEENHCFQAIDPVLSQNKYQLFTRMVFLLNTACRDSDQELFKVFPELVNQKYRYTCPAGQAWHTVFQYIYNNRSLIPWTNQNLGIVSDALKTWTTKYKTGETTRLAGQIAMYLRHAMWGTESRYSLEQNASFIAFTDVMLAAAMELKQELGSIFDSAKEPPLERGSEYYLLIQKSLSNAFSCGNIALAIPEKLLSLAESHWCYLSRQEHDSGFAFRIEHAFGLSLDTHTAYSPESALQTPLYLLLNATPMPTVNMILRVMSYTSRCYKDSHLAEKYSECYLIQLHFPDGTIQSQVCSNRLWNMYRGTSVTPDLLKSILMALEKWLLRFVESSDEETSCQICEYLLRHSWTAAITAVVLSAVIAYPEKLFPISCILLKTKEIFLLDISRWTEEHSANFFKGISPFGRQFDEERIESNNLPFRKKRFEEILLGYQLEKGALSEEQWEQQQSQLYAAFDEATKDIASWEESYQFAYYRSDLRKCQVQCQSIAQDRVTLSIAPVMPDHLKKRSAQTQQNQKEFMRHMPLMLWSDAKLQHDPSANEKYPQFDDIQLVMNEVHQILEEEKKDFFFNISAAINACAVLVQNNKAALGQEDFIFCKVVLLTACFESVVEDTDAAAYNLDKVFPALASLVPGSTFTADWSSPFFMLLVLTIVNSSQRGLLHSIASTLWQTSPDAVLKLMYAYAVWRPQYASSIPLRRRDITTQAFFESHSQELQSLFQKDGFRLEDIPLEGLGMDQLIALQQMMPPEPVEGSLDFVLKIGRQVWSTLFGSQPASEKIHRDFEGEQGYIQWLSDYLLNLSEEQQSLFLEHLMRHVRYDREFAHLLQNIIVLEDTSPRYNAFWKLWNLLKSYIFSAFELLYPTNQVIGREPSIDYGMGNVLTEFLLAGPFWKEKITSWHSLREDCILFYKASVIRMGAHPAVLYSIGRILNGIGAKVFFESGVEWLSDIISNNPQLRQASLPINTVYYIEEYMYRYVYQHLYSFKSNPLRKREVLNVLNFLVDVGSSFGFLLREDII